MHHVAFLLILGFVLIAPTAAAADEQPAPGSQLDALRQARREAAHRKRRMIFNNDGDDVIYTKKEPTAEALLALRTAPLVGSQVDSIFYSNSMCFGHALHESRVMEPFLSTEYIFKDNGLPQLLQRGIDPIRVMVDFGHRHGIEVFWDLRMNDTHDAGLDGYGPYLVPKLKQDHPEYLVGTAQKQPKYGTWSSVNFAVPEVRDLACRFAEEVCQKFDVDGIELDFFRHACFFKSVAEGGRASREELDMMTDLLRRIRQMTEREGLRRGRPILIAIRVPDSVEYCQGIGLDLEKWLAEGLADLLIGTCYFQCNPWEYLVELGRRHGVPVYPSLSESRVQGETRFSRQSIESYRARAARAWAAGADGIYLFNYFDPRGAVWRELGDPAALQRMDKLYFVTVRNGDPERYLAGGRSHRHVPILTPADPWLVPTKEFREVELAVADDLAGAVAAGLKPQATCHVRATGRNLELTLNGQRLENPSAQDDWLDFAVPPELLKKGNNRLAFPGRGPEGVCPHPKPGGFLAGRGVVDPLRRRPMSRAQGRLAGGATGIFSPASRPTAGRPLGIFGMLSEWASRLWEHPRKPAPSSNTRNVNPRTMLTSAMLIWGRFVGRRCLGSYDARAGHACCRSGKPSRTAVPLGSRHLLGCGHRPRCDTQGAAARRRATQSGR